MRLQGALGFLTTFAVVVSLSPSDAWAQSGASTILVDQHARTTVVEKNGRSTTIPDGAEVRVATSPGVTLRVKNTNSVLYNCEVADSEVSVPELDSLKAFLRVLGPYVPDVAKSFRSHAAAAAAAGAPEAAALWLDSVNIALHGPSGVHPARMRSLSVLDSIRTNFKGTGLPSALGASKFCTDSTCTHLKAIADLLRALDSLENANTNLRAYLSKAGPDVKAKYADLASGVAAALGDEDQLLESAYAAEKLTHATANAKPVIDCKVLHVSWDKGRSFTLTVKPNPDPVLIRLATDESYTYKATLLPDWFIHPVLGLSLVYAHGAQFLKFGTTKLTGDSVRIVSTGSTDSRVTYGLSLGLSLRPLESGAFTGLALIPIELVVNPTNDVKAIGIGAGLGYRLLRLSGGFLFVKHTVLDGETLDQRIGSADALKTKDTYGRRKPYLSFSIMGIPPFVREK